MPIWPLVPLHVYVFFIMKNYFEKRSAVYYSTLLHVPENLIEFVRNFDFFQIFFKKKKQFH